MASLVELFSKAFQIPVVQRDGNRLTTALRLKAQTQIDIFGKPPGVLALLGDERRVIGLLDPKAAHALGVFRKVEDVGRAYEAWASPVVQRATQQSHLSWRVAQDLEVEALPVAALRTSRYFAVEFFEKCV